MKVLTSASTNFSTSGRPTASKPSSGGKGGIVNK